MPKNVQDGEVVEKIPHTSKQSQSGNTSGETKGAAQGTVKKLLRPTQGRVLVGVCAAFANYFSIDATVVRLIVVALALLAGGFPLIAAYIIAWLVIPEEK